MVGMQGGKPFEKEQDSEQGGRITGRLRIPKDTTNRWLVFMIAALLAAALVSPFIYNRVHCFDSFRVTGSAQEKDVEGTRYAMLSDRIIKYGHDGLFCVDSSNHTLWSAAYSMQTPICDICEDVMVIAEQQGRKVYVLNSKGLLGNFETSMNIRKARVGANGVAALILDDEDASWVNLYSADGLQIASVRYTLDGSGYPLDAAVTPNAKRMTVTSISTENGMLIGNLTFYDFSSSSADRHLMETLRYENTVFPEVFYASGQVPVAVGDNCFAVFSSEKKPSQKIKVPLEREAVSCFHSGSGIGFLFRSDKTDVKYEMELFNYSGKKTMQTDCSFEYTGVEASGEEILLNDGSRLYAYRISGRQKINIDYEKEVRYFTHLKGQRKYLVITGDSMDRIRIE